MEVINIHNWTNNQVLQWFKGLDENLHHYEVNLREAEVLGEQLLSLTHEDLHNLQITLVGHQELFLDAVALLQQLDYGLDTETLQSRALCLKCRCRGLRSSITTRRREAEEYEYDGGISLSRGATNQLLHLASDVLDEGKQLILWLDRAPFNMKADFRSTRERMVQLCYELSVTMQQSVFACVIEDAALNICTELENSADGIVQSSDAITIQTVSLEQIHLRNVNPSEGLGIYIKATFEGHHVVTGTRIGSVAEKAKKLYSGDELIAVNGKAVVGWTLGALVLALKEHTNDVSLLIKKRPQLLNSVANNLLVQRSDRSKLLHTSAPVRRINMPSQPMNKASPGALQQKQRSSKSSSGTWSSYKSHDHHGNPSWERNSFQSTSEANSVESTSLSSSKQRLSSATSSNERAGDKSSKYENLKVSSGYPDIISRLSNKRILLEEPTSPIQMLRIPPPPEEPYSPTTTDQLAVPVDSHGSRDSRSASPNSLLDIEHKRRYTVIGGSEVDQIWYEDVIRRVEKCNVTPSSSRHSQDHISSSEEVFTSVTPPVRFTSAATLQQQEDANVITRRRQRHVIRPVSMPPNYYASVHRVAPRANNTPSTLFEEGSQRHHRNPRHPNRYVDVGRSSHSSNRSSPAENSSREREEQRYRYAEYRFGTTCSRFNHNNHNNTSSSEAIGNGEGRAYPAGNELGSKSKLSSRNPPKPPPRSSSITKLSYRHSADVTNVITHPRQASLPSESMLSTLDSQTGQNSFPYKPSANEKPSGLRSLLKSKAPKKKSDKGQRRSSSSHLNSSHSPEKEGNRMLHSAEKKSKTSPKQSEKRKKLHSRSSVDHISTEHVAAGLVGYNDQNDRSGEPVNLTSTDERPVPKPRTVLAKKNPSGGDDHGRPRSSSHGNMLSNSTARPIPSNRRKSAGHVMQKTKIDSVIDSSNLENKNTDLHKDSLMSSSEVQHRSVTSLRSSPPTARMSYNAAIENTDRKDQSDFNASLVSYDVPQPSDSYELKVIAGVPVRLRKGFSRFTTTKTKASPDKSKSGISSTVTADMKSQRRVSCRDLGHGDCQGWLWKKKTISTNTASGPLSLKWAKRWVVIKNGGVYCYRSNSDDEERAECYICLPGYQVAPATECKRKFVFRIAHRKRKTFFFAAERQMDMSRWMNKMALASIEYKYDQGSNTSECKSRDDDYYSESDEDTTTAEGEINGKVIPSSDPETTITSFETFDGTVGEPSPDKSPTVLTKGETSQTDSNFLSALPPSPGRRKPTVNSQERRHRGSDSSRVARRMLSKSLELLPDSASEAPDENAKHRRSQEIATKQAERLNARQPPPTPVKANSTGIRKLSLSTFYTSMTSEEPQSTTDASRPRSSNIVSADPFSFHSPKENSGLTSTTSSSSTTSSGYYQTSSGSRRDVVGRPTVKKDREQFGAFPPTSPQSSSPVGVVACTDVMQEIATEQEKENREDLMNDLCRNIKQSDVDFRGVNRRTTLRRRMTVLSRDPNINEKMLRRRALEREQKAKELELAYFDKLLSKRKITTANLHSWINQHPSLVAEMGTIRRLSKRQRHPVVHANQLAMPQYGDKARLSTVTSEDGRSSMYDDVNTNKDVFYDEVSSEECQTPVERISVACEDATSYISDSVGGESNANCNNNNSLNISSEVRQRPTAWAVGKVGLPDSRHLLASKDGAYSQQKRLRKKIVTNRTVASRTTCNAAYLETDL